MISKAKLTFALAKEKVIGAYSTSVIREVDEYPWSA